MRIRKLSFPEEAREGSPPRVGDVVLKQSTWHEETSVTVSDGDYLTETTSRKIYRWIPFDDLLQSCCVKHDNLAEPPWESTDCYPHTVECLTREVPVRGYREFLHFCKAVYTQDGKTFAIRVTDQHIAKIGSWYDYYRADGCPKQVARELHAAHLSAMVAQIRAWRIQGGYTAYVAQFVFETPTVSFNEQLYGIDDEAYAWKWLKTEILPRVIADLTAAGYRIADVPEEYQPRQQKRSNVRFRRNLNRWTWPLLTHGRSQWEYKFRHTRRRSRKLSRQRRRREETQCS